MEQSSLPWALLVVGNPSSPRDPSRAQAKVDPPATVLARALALTSIAKTGCLLANSLRAQWNFVIQQLWSSNVFSLEPDERLVDGVVGRLASIALQEPDATVILIPYNHCAVEELTWLASARGALRLGATNRNTVYLLHDDPDNDPRSTVTKPEVCTSSVLIGSVAALLALCRGTRETAMVDLVVGIPEKESGTAVSDSSDAPDLPLNLVHIRLAEEYASLQRQDVWHRLSRQIDVQA